MNTKTLIKKIEKITDEYGPMHEVTCDLNSDDGSYDGCDCWVKNMVEQIANALLEDEPSK